MKKSGHFLHVSSAQRRSRLRQAFIKGTKSRRQARQEVFFIQEKNHS